MFSAQQLAREAADAAASPGWEQGQRETLMEAAQILADIGDHLGASSLLQHTVCITASDPRYLCRLIDMARSIGCEELERKAHESLDSLLQAALSRRTASDRVGGAAGGRKGSIIVG